MLTKTGMCQHILAKVPNTRFQENVSGVSSDASCRQMDRHDEANNNSATDM
jgi:hypothetical protein